MFKNVLPNGNDRENTRPLFNFVVKKYAPVARPDFPKDVILEALFHAFDHCSCHSGCSIVKGWVLVQ